MISDLNSLYQKANTFFSLLQIALFLLFVSINWGSVSISILLFIFLLSLGINSWLVRRYTDSSVENTLFVAVTNLIFAFLFIELSGGVHSPFYPMYYLPWISMICIVAKKQDRNYVLGIALLATILSLINVLLSGRITFSTEWIRFGVYCVSYFSLGTSVWLFKQILITKTLEAEHDSLTGLLNRNGGEKILKKAIEDYHKQKTNFSLVLCDIDHFKKINDTYGHLFGDAILKETGCILDKMSPDSAKVIRWGGEEFLILFSGIHMDESFEILNVIRKHIANYTYTYLENKTNITISAGIIQMKEQYNRIEDLVNEVDKLLYSAKDEGRNLIVI